MTHLIHRLSAAWILILAGCCLSPETGDGSEATEEPPTLPDSWPALSPITEPERTQDGIPILRLPATDLASEGDVTWIPDSDSTLEWPLYEATDGAQVYFAIRRENGRFSDLLVRGDQQYTDILAGLAGLTTHPGGCAAARNGDLLLSAPVERDEDERDARGDQVIWRLSPDGELARTDTPNTMGPSDECRAWLADDGRYALGLFGIVAWDGQQLREDRDWFVGRTVMGRPDGPRYCFDHCNAREKAATDPATAVLKDAIGCNGANWAAHDDWIAGICSDGSKAVRMREGQQPQVLTDIPESATSFGQYLALTADGSLVIALDYHYASYVVWPADGGALSPVRTLDAGDVIADASPTLLLRGLPSTVPDAEVGAILLAPRTGFGANGPTSVYSAQSRSGEAHQARMKRAAVVLPAGKHVAAHEAVVDLKCGAYVRSPLGWEGEQISDWSPPVLPALHAAAVTHPEQCLPLKQVVAVPGALDLLLARGKDGHLYAAWLPAPLPLPSGSSHWDEEPPPPPKPQHPEPGTGWTQLSKIKALSGVEGIAEHEPFKAQELPPWAAGGGAVITTDEGREVLLTGHGAMTLPPGTAPMATDPYARGAWGAKGKMLVVCKDGCKVLLTGVDGEITAVVPRTADQLILGYADGRVGVYTVPAEGNDVSSDPLEATLEAYLKGGRDGA